MLKFIAKGIGILFGIAALLIAILFIAISIFNSPTYAWRLLRYGRSDTQDYKIFPSLRGGVDRRSNLILRLHN